MIFCGRSTAPSPVTPRSGRVPLRGEPREREANEWVRGWTVRLLPGFSFAILSPAALAMPPYLVRARWL
jgi:hypothetical protein